MIALPRNTCDTRLRRRDPRPGPISICHPRGARLPVAVSSQPIDPIPEIAAPRRYLLMGYLPYCYYDNVTQEMISGITIRRRMLAEIDPIQDHLGLGFTPKTRSGLQAPRPNP